MQHARFHTVCPMPFPKLGPHSVSAVPPWLLWCVACRQLAAVLPHIAGVTALALSIHCTGANAETLRSPSAIASNLYVDFTDEASRRFGVPASWVRAVMHVESAGNPKAVSPKGAMGLMQLMPDTWSALRIQYRLGNDPFDPHDNILGGAAYLRELFDRFGASGFLAAYNAGPKRYQDYLAGLRPLNDETKHYLSTLAQMLPDLRLGIAPPATSGADDWRVSGLFTISPASHPPSNSAPDASASQSTTTSPTFALGPQSDGLFVSVRMPDQR